MLYADAALRELSRPRLFRRGVPNYSGVGYRMPDRGMTPNDEHDF
jgi:hypothetical protein